MSKAGFLLYIPFSGFSHCCFFKGLLLIVWTISPWIIRPTGKPDRRHCPDRSYQKPRCQHAGAYFSSIADQPDKLSPPLGKDHSSLTGSWNTAAGSLFGPATGKFSATTTGAAKLDSTIPCPDTTADQPQTKCRGYWTQLRAKLKSELAPLRELLLGKVLMVGSPLLGPGRSITGAPTVQQVLHPG